MNRLSKILRYLLRYQTFISYSSKDRIYLNKLTQTLENYGSIVKYAPRDVIPMKNWRIEIKHKIRESDFYIFLASQSALRKKIIQQEITIADRYNIPCLIIALPNIKDLSDKSLGLIEVTQYIKWNDQQLNSKIKKIIWRGLFRRSIQYIILFIIFILISVDLILKYYQKHF